jgi:2-phospho-L-lactate guanylyltransferase
LSIWAIVPVKSFASAKSRLASVLREEERAGLSRDFLQHTLAVLAAVPAVAHRLVISRDPAALEMARADGAESLMEAGAGDLNEALEQATRAAQEGQAGAVLILPTDLPLLKTADVEQVILPMSDGPGAVLVPDRHDAGTNALFVRPAGGLQYAFGEGSFARHRTLAERSGLLVRICRLPGMALDVDEPEDWRLFQAALKR